jgi:nitrogen-specific signal transduction histidine kinase
MGNIGDMTEEPLSQAQQLAAMKVVAGDIAHELRNLLAICSSAAQFLMAEEITPEFRRQCAQKVLQGIQRASGILDYLAKSSQPSDKEESP